MANTTNFGWETPDDTDLVKDGAAAMRTLGNSIDASFVDLKGGTTGQILSKNSNTDLDFTWIANDQGDITAVTAGTGISGGGTSGAVTITNSMATEITASGDIIVGTGSGTFDNLPIGSTGQVLTADTTVSPYKVKWADASASGPTFSAESNTEQNISSATDTKVTFQVENWDSDSAFASSRFTPQKAGYYQVTGSISYVCNASTTSRVYVFKNGAAYNPISTSLGLAVANPTPSVSGLVSLNGTTDYIELYGYNDAGSGTRQFYRSWFSAVWIRSL